MSDSKQGLLNVPQRAQPFEGLFVQLGPLHCGIPRQIYLGKSQNIVYGQLDVIDLDAKRREPRGSEQFSGSRRASLATGSSCWSFPSRRVPSRV